MIYLVVRNSSHHMAVGLCIQKNLNFHSILKFLPFWVIFFSFFYLFVLDRDRVVLDVVFETCPLQEY